MTDVLLTALTGRTPGQSPGPSKPLFVPWSSPRVGAPGSHARHWRRPPSSPLAGEGGRGDHEREAGLPVGTSGLHFVVFCGGVPAVDARVQCFCWSVHRGLAVCVLTRLVLLASDAGLHLPVEWEWTDEHRFRNRLGIVQKIVNQQYWIVKRLEPSDSLHTSACSPWGSCYPRLIQFMMRIPAPQHPGEVRIAKRTSQPTKTLHRGRLRVQRHEVFISHQPECTCGSWVQLFSCCFIKMRPTRCAPRLASFETQKQRKSLVREGRPCPGVSRTPGPHQSTGQPATAVEGQKTPDLLQYRGFTEARHRDWGFIRTHHHLPPTRPEVEIVRSTNITGYTLIGVRIHPLEPWDTHVIDVWYMKTKKKRNEILAIPHDTYRIYT